jgi:hypothetical protein
MPTTHHVNHAPWPQTVAEAIDRLLGNMSTADREEFAGLSEDDLIQMHFGMGMGIRNQFGLWEGNNALLGDCAAAKGLSGDFSWLSIDPNDASTIILTALWRHLQDQE